MIKLWFVNFDYFAQDEYATLEEALAGARKAGFEAALISYSGVTLGSWSPLYGFRSYL